MEDRQRFNQTELTAYAQRKKDEEANKPKVEFEAIPYLGNFKADDTPYDPLDFKEVRKRILDNVEIAVKTRFPLENDKYLLAVDDVHYQEHNYGVKDEKIALRDGKSLTARLKGTWNLYDKATGALLDTKTTTLLNVPYMTDKGTFIRNGSEYGLKHMFRLRSGVYTRIKNDGNIATHINPEQGTGRQSTINMDPETGVFTVKMGTRNYGLLPLLKAMNADPAAIEKVWGKELFETNFNKYRNIMTGADTKGLAEYTELWNDKYSKMKLDPETTGYTLGVPYKEINSDVFLNATGKILKIAQTYDPSLTDPRDSLLFQKVMGPADYVPEKIVRDGGGLARNLFNQISKAGNLSIIQPGIYQTHVDSVFLDDKHAAYVEGASPFESIDLNATISRLGEGGIGDLRAAPAESRHVQNSYLGFVDLVRSPESLAVGLNNYLTYGTKKDSNGNLYSMFIKNGETRPKYIKMTEAAKSVVATPEYNIAGADPNEFIPAIVKGREIEYVRRKDVDYYLSTPNRMMSVGASTIPGIGGIRSNRTLMGCLHPDTPLKAAYNPDGIPNYLKIKASELLHISDIHNYYLPVLVDKGDVEKGIRLEPIRGVHKTEKTNCYRVSVSGKGCFVTENHKWWVSDIKGTRLLTTLQLKEGMQVPVAETPVDSDVIPDWCPIEAVYPVCTDVDYFVDIDVDDNIYALANGIFTHNSKYPLQALPLQNREAPLVQRALTLDDGTETTTESFVGGALGARFSPVDGKIISVDADEIHIRGVDGQKYTVDLYNEYPANQKGFINNFAKVKPGQQVKANQLVASSNYTTDDGQAALGVNLKVAFLNAPEGGTFEDGIYLSESAAKKLTSEQLYKTNISDDDDIDFDKNKFVNLFKAEKFTPEQLGKLDDSGIVKVGTTLQYGDPMVIGVQNKPAGLHGIAKHATAPYIEKWEHHYPGVVTDVTAGGKKAAVYVKTYTPMKPGDKMCYDDKTEVYTKRGWILFKDVKEDDQFFTLDYRSGHTYWSPMTRYYSFKHKGILYKYESKYVSLRLTSEHMHLTAASPNGWFMSLQRIKDIKGKPFYHVIGTDLSNPACFARADDDEVPYKECWVRYEGNVYCVEIPETHTVYVRRNGKCCWSGNSNRFGAKGVVSRIVPDEDMLKDSNGEPFDMIQSSLGIPSRINPVQMAELQLAKVAKYTGVPEVIPDFPTFDIREYTLNKLKENGLSDTETCYDPTTGMKVNDVATGYMYNYKLKHMAESKKGARATGDYTSEDLPLKGGSEGARRFGSMEVGALVGHTGVNSEVFKDAKLIKGQRNDEFWFDVRDGKQPAKPGTPLVHKKFFAHLQAAGVHLDDRGRKIGAFVATDEDIRNLTKNRQVTAGSTYDSKDLRPIKGGLFDPDIFGDEGDQWGYYELPEPIINPLMVDSIKDILGWKSSEMQEVLEGARKLDGKIGTEAVIAALDKMDFDKELEHTKMLLKDKTTPVSKRSDLAKKYRALYSIAAQDKEPNDFFLTRIPILPPRFRPVSIIGNDVGIVADANFLYKKMIDAVEDFNEAKAVLPEEELMDARKTLYNSIEAVVGIKDPADPKLQSKKVEGVLRWAFGKGSPKLGSLQRKVYGAAVDVGGRNTITPDSSLNMDEVGISEETAWKMYEPFVVRKLRQRGYHTTKAVDMVIERDKEAFRALEECLEERPLLINRAPTLHKYNIMAARPRITKGNTLHVNPEICKLHNADMDGDTMNYHVPVSQQAVKEAYEKMLPSRNLLSPSNMRAHYKPVAEFAQGLFLGSRINDKKKPIRFNSLADAQKALKEGLIKWDDPIDIPDAEANKLLNKEK